MTEPEKSSETPSRPPLRERVGRYFEVIGMNYSGAPVERTPLHEAYRLATEAHEMDEDSLQFGKLNLEAGKLYEEADAWIDAEGCYHSAFEYFRNWYPTHNREEMARGLVESGLGLERTLNQRGARGRALATHVMLEEAAGIELPRPALP